MNKCERNTHIIDATGVAVGRLASRVVILLRGKNKPTFAPHIDAGDFVTIENAAKVKFTGRKFVQKDFYHHTMHPGGIKRMPLAKLFSKDPALVVRRAIYGMLPKNKLREEMMKRITIKI